MGTSQSSNGPGANVVLVPPWAEPLPEPVDPQPDPQPDPAEPADPEGPGQVQPPPPTSPPPHDPTAGERRFVSTRRSLSSYARTGDATRMRRAVSNYVRTGYGGSANLSRRLGSTSTTARSLGRVLDPTDTGSGLDRAFLDGKSADEVMDAVVEASRPHDGTLDAESSREAIRDALSDLLKEFADADLLQLTGQQRAFAIESYAAHDVYRRFTLDVGKHLVANAPNATIGLSRLKQARNYIRQTIAESFRKLADAGQAMTRSNVRNVVASALADSLAVFEGYLP